MQNPTAAWAHRAEADLATARRELHVEDGPNFEAVCVHAQLSALKFLKARLMMAEVPFPSTSHLVVLLELCLDVEPDWEEFRPHLRSLNQLAARLEDPDCISDGPMAAEAYSLARAFGNKARTALEPETELAS